MFVCDFEYQTLYSGKINYQPLTDDQNLYLSVRLSINKCAALVLIQLRLLSHRHHFLIGYIKDVVGWKDCIDRLLRK